MADQSLSYDADLVIGTDTAPDLFDLTTDGWNYSWINDIPPLFKENFSTVDKSHDSEQSSTDPQRHEYSSQASSKLSLVGLFLMCISVLSL